MFDTASLLAGNPLAEHLRAMGIEVPDDPYPDERLGVAAPAPTEYVVGVATDEEMMLYSALVDANAIGERLFVDVLATSTERVARGLAQAMTFEEAMKAATQNAPSHFPEELWEAHHRYSLIHSMLWWAVGRRLGLHAHHLGLRTNRAIVSTGLRR